ncbi:putative splicing factor 3a [Leptomonas pyrrhocoris]|uniref:Putative splicing factor 3a n=1 Tax=Leptomonas pyrrhocoris TaxID=157538 RepID=A0A0N0VGF9_LEPPY|nr:putative splicing factor 3a [Leptomonas pyrrhocoris]KPA83214.1 putative splicing factor 3a [Leptomonas pyrrhocoris]|eukprot:XP_015661653.1 putative splicing factor 3a [Leptomonas pyrrhocoris]
MQTNVLERVRALEADIEKCIDSIVQQELFASDITNERHRILIDHFVIQQAEVVKTTAEKLLDAYLDEDDITKVQNAPAESEDDVAAALKEFEAKLADIREYHHTYNNLPPIKNELNTPNPKMLNDIFSLNERFGACLDIDAHYTRYSAFMVRTRTVAESCEGADVAEELLAELAPLAPSSILAWSPLWPGRLDFFRFPKALPQILLHETESHRKIVGFELYRAFVDGLLAYLVDFHGRVYPFKKSALERLLTEVEGDGEEYWAALLAAKAEVTSVAAAAASASAVGDDDADANEEGERVAEEEAAVTAEDAAERKAAQRRKAAARIAVENKVSCGLTIPPSLRRHAKNYSLWPIAMIEKLIHTQGGTKKSVEDCDDTKEADAGEKSKAMVKAGYPTSMAEVKAVCMTEAKAAALLHSLLFNAFENTDKALLRDYSRTMEELESDRAQADDEFTASLEELTKNLASTMEGTVAHAARYNLQLALKDTKGSIMNSTNPRYGRGRGGPAAAAPAEVAPEPEEEKAELLGENGEPIPRWLAQLHQLDKVFKCDVCGGTVYKGPKVFREHFGADRHAEGLRRLGVTQHLKSFEGITSIREVVELRDRLSASEGGFRKRLRDNMDHEEIQDGRGRVLSGKVYEHRQNSRRDGR